MKRLRVASTLHRIYANLYLGGPLRERAGGSPGRASFCRSRYLLPPRPSQVQYELIPGNVKKLPSRARCRARALRHPLQVAYHSRNGSKGDGTHWRTRYTLPSHLLAGLSTCVLLVVGGWGSESFSGHEACYRIVETPGKSYDIKGPGSTSGKLGLPGGLPITAKSGPWLEPPD